MAKEFGQVKTSVWSSEKLSGCDNLSRLVYLYLLTNEHGNSIGCYRLPHGYAVADLGIDMDAYLDCIDTLSRRYLIRYEKASQTVYICGYLEQFPLNNPKHSIRAAKDALALDGKEAKGLVIKDILDQQALKDDTLRHTLSDTLSILYPDGIDKHIHIHIPILKKEDTNVSSKEREDEAPKKRQKRATSWPMLDDTTPKPVPQDWILGAIQKYPEFDNPQGADYLQRVAEQFVTYWAGDGKPKQRWQQTWMNWIARDRENGNGSNKFTQPANGDAAQQTNVRKYL